MATNYTYYSFSHVGLRYYVLKTKASNIQLVSFQTKYGEDKFIKDTPYYGMNASFFEEATSTILNIAYQDGTYVGPDTQGYTNDGCGTGIVCWNGLRLRQYNDVQNGSSTLVPKTSGSWAQGGFSLYLCDPDWKDKFNVQRQRDPKLLTSLSPRTGILINENTNDVFLFMAPGIISTVEGLRNAMMSDAGITEGGNSGPWKAILTDGGASTQMFCAEYAVLPLGSLQRKVPQIIALKNNT